MTRMTKASNPEIYCHYEHCRKRLSSKQLARNARKERDMNHRWVALYCCRRHKELATQQRRDARRRALREAGALA